MNLRVELVPLSLVHQTWLLVEKFLEEALKWGEDDYTVEQVKVFITKGEWMLLVAVDEQNAVHGAAAVNIYNMPKILLKMLLITRLYYSKKTI